MLGFRAEFKNYFIQNAVKYIRDINKIVKFNPKKLIQGFLKLIYTARKRITSNSTNIQKTFPD